MKILVADCDGTHTALLVANLQALDASFSITLTAGGETLLAAMRRIAPEIVIVDMARPDRDGLDSVRAIQGQAPVLMFIDEDDPAFMEEAIAAGVTSYHVHGVSLPAIKPILRTATAVFQQIRSLQARLEEAEAQIAARQTIDAAKRRLMTEQKMSEPAAHRFLQRRAMDQQKKLSDVAATFLQQKNREGTGS
jgi:response regulator NasT